MHACCVVLWTLFALRSDSKERRNDAPIQGESQLNPRKLVPLTEAARLYDVSPRTIRRRISDGTVTGYRIGPRLIRVDMAELAQALAVIPTVKATKRANASTFELTA
jgi:excisionase family DNA binding protein